MEALGLKSGETQLNRVFLIVRFVVVSFLFLLALASASPIFPASIFATRPKGRCKVTIIPDKLQYIYL